MNLSYGNRINPGQFSIIEEIMKSNFMVPEDKLEPPVPYSLLSKDQDTIILSIPAPGQTASDFDVEFQDNILKVKSKVPEREGKIKYLKKGLTARPFEQAFALDEYCEPVSATCEHGLLEIEIKRIVPEEKAPRKIKIS